MRVSRVSMENFRCFQNQTLEFSSSRVLVLGDHGHGKSTLFDAIRFLMTGRCRGLDKGDGGVEDALLRLGADSKTLAVSANITHRGKSYTLTRTWANGAGQFRVAGWGGSSNGQQAEWLSVLGVSLEGLSALLDSETFFALDHADAKTLVLNFLKVTVVLPSGETIDLEELEKRSRAAFDARAIATKQVKLVPMATAPTQELPTNHQMEDIEAKLASLALERERLIAVRAGQQGGAQVYLEQFASTEKALTGVRAQMVELGGDPAAAIGECANRRGRADAELAGLAEPESVESDGVGFDDLTEQIEDLRAHTPSGGCVLSSDVACPVKSAKFKDAAKSLQVTADGLKAAHEAKAERRMARFGVQTLIDTLAKDAARLDGVKVKWDLLVSVEAELVSKLDELSPKLPDAVADTSAVDGLIETLDGRIVKGHAILQGKKALQGDWQRHGEAVDKRHAAEKAQRDAAADCELYGPTGARVAALANVIPTFEASVNAALVPFGFTLAVSVDPWEVRVNGLRYVTLSASEKLRVGIALQVALAQTTGIGFTLLDQLDMLLTAPRTVLTKLVMSPNVGLDQVWLARAFEPSAADPAMTGLAAGTQVVRL